MKFRNYRHIIAATVIVCLLLAGLSFYIFPNITYPRIWFHGNLTLLGAVFPQFSRDAASFVAAVERDIANRTAGRYVSTPNYISAGYVCTNTDCQMNTANVGVSLTPRFVLALLNPQQVQLEYSINFARGEFNGGTSWVSDIDQRPAAELNPQRIIDIVNRTISDEREGFVRRNPAFQLYISWGAATDWQWQVQLASPDEYDEWFVS